MTPGTRNKFGAPMLEPEAFRKQMYCIEESACDIVTFWSPAVIRHQGNCAPLPPSLRLWWCAIKIGKIPKIISVSIPNVMTFYSMNICNFQYGIGLAQTANKGYWRHFGLLHVFFVIFMPVPRVSSAWTCVCFANNKTFPTLNKLLFEG